MNIKMVSKRILYHSSAKTISNFFKDEKEEYLRILAEKLDVLGHFNAFYVIYLQFLPYEWEHYQCGLNTSFWNYF